MADNYLIPRPTAPFAQNGAPPTKQWYDFLNGLYRLYQSSDAGIQDQITQLCYKLGSPDGTIANIPPFGGVHQVNGINSIFSFGLDFVDISLVNDVLEAPALTFYGAIDEGFKGWHPYSVNFQKTTDAGTDYLDLVDVSDSGEGFLLAITRDGKGRITGTRDATITGTSGRITVAHGDASDGVPTIDLATLSDAGGGSLVKIDRDSFGRVLGTSTPTTDDLAEGSTNLYFTNERAQDAVGSILDGTGDVPLTYDDAGNKISAALSSGVLASLALADSSIQPGDNVSELTNDAGYVSGPASSVDGDAVLFDGTTGKLIKDGGSFGSLVRSVVLTGLSLATSAVIAATDTVLQAFGKLQAQITDNLIPAGYIDGLQMQWVSGTALTVSSGSAYIQGSSKVLRATTAIAKTGLSLSASTWYHVYLYDNAGTPDFELSTTAPASPYNGTARSKTGDTSRRYIGSVRSGSGATLYNFRQSGNRILYREDIANGTLPFRVLSNGSATIDTIIACSSVVPVTASTAVLRMQNSSTVGGFRAKQSDGTYSTSGAANQSISPGGLGIFDLALNGNQEMIYFYSSTPSGGGGYIDISGYTYER